MQVSAVGNGYGYGLSIGMSGLQSQQGTKGARSLSGKQLADLDTDGDGSISQSEFQSFLTGQTATQTTAADQRATDLFKKIDTDGDGKISSTELSAFQQKIGQHHHRHAEQTQDSQQTSSSSKLQDLVNQVYKSADSNGDGQLSQTELTSWLQQSLGSGQLNATF